MTIETEWRLTMVVMISELRALAASSKGLTRGSTFLSNSALTADGPELAATSLAAWVAGAPPWEASKRLTRPSSFEMSDASC